jgi:quercetin dioxygenase-like cupin family protein
MEDMKIPLQDYEGLFQLSELMAAKGIVFQASSGVEEHGWHNAPRRQFVITLAGRIEIEVGDGTRRSFGPGDLLLAEDLTGRGHVTRSEKNALHRAVLVTLE